MKDCSQADTWIWEQSPQLKRLLLSPEAWEQNTWSNDKFMFELLQLQLQQEEHHTPFLWSHFCQGCWSFMLVQHKEILRTLFPTEIKNPTQTSVLTTPEFMELAMWTGKK